MVSKQANMAKVRAFKGARKKLQGCRKFAAPPSRSKKIKAETFTADRATTYSGLIVELLNGLTPAKIKLMSGTALLNAISALESRVFALREARNAGDTPLADIIKAAYAMRLAGIIGPAPAGQAALPPASLPPAIVDAPTLSPVTATAVGGGATPGPSGGLGQGPGTGSDLSLKSNFVQDNPLRG